MSKTFISTPNDATPSCSAFSAPSGTGPFDPVVIDPSLIRAAELELVIAPVLAHSKYSSARAYVGTPTSNLDLIAQGVAQHRECNWTLHVGASEIVVLEIDTRIGYVPLSVLCRNSFGRWTKTIQFRDDIARFLLFRGTGQRVRFLGQRFRGLRIHSGNAFIFLPPSWYVSDRLGSSRRLVYLDHKAPLMDAPDWLWDLAPSSHQSHDGFDRLPPSATPAPWETPDHIQS